MKIKFFLLPIFLIALFTSTSCTYRLVDFTVISSKNVDIRMDKTMGKKTNGDKTYFLGIGFNLKDALDIALDKAGPGYDLLVDGVVRYTAAPFVAIVKVEGTAISSSKMRLSMGDKAFEEWLCGKDVFDPNQEVKTVTE